MDHTPRKIQQPLQDITAYPSTFEFDLAFYDGYLRPAEERTRQYRQSLNLNENHSYLRIIIPK